MSVKSILVTGKLSSDLTYAIWDPETSDIKRGIWAISLEKVILKYEEDQSKYFSFCVKTNLVCQTTQDQQGRINHLNTCLGIFSSKGSQGDEMLVHNVNQTWFQITVPANELRVFIENPLDGEKITKKLKLALYFLYKRLQ